MISRNRRLRTMVRCYGDTRLRLNNNTQNVAGAAEAVEATTCCIHHQLLYGEKQNITEGKFSQPTEVTRSFFSLSYTTVYIICL